MNTDTLPFPGLHARADDPSTSKAAADAIAPILANECNLVLEAIRTLTEVKGNGATAYEVRNYLRDELGHDSDQNCVARRCTDLKNTGLIENPNDWQRQSPKSKRWLMVWVPTPDGWSAR